jgi:FKBP-type peptidyl-prolyl cis-trans isomerase
MTQANIIMHKIAKRTKSSVLALSALAGLSLIGCDKPDLTTDAGKYSYSIGRQITSNQIEQGIEIDPKAFCAGVKDGAAKKESRITDQEMSDARRAIGEKIREKMMAEAEKNTKEGQDYLEQNKKKDGVKVTASGLQYREVRAGKGKKPTAKDMVKVHYKGTLINGKEFDSSYKRGEPAEFALAGVIPGWTEGLQLMNEGSVYEFVIPSELAYGQRGQRPDIEPNSTLVFEVELLEIKK